MKKLLLFAGFFLAVFAASSQTLDVAPDKDKDGNPIYDDIVLYGDDAPAYIFIDDVSPITCNKAKLSVYEKDYVNGKSESNYFVYLTTLEYDMEPNYYGYWFLMTFHKTGTFKVVANCYLNGVFKKAYGSVEFDILDEDDYGYGW